MIFHTDIEQGSAEWLALHIGKLTASRASKLVTASGSLSGQYKAEIGRNMAEYLGWQEPDINITTDWMDHGTETEPEARLWFTVETGLNVAEVAFIEDDSGLIGCSPDGMVHEGTIAFSDENEPLELKCPKPGTHIKWMMEGNVVPKDHIAQVHFQMAVCKAERGWFMSYAPPAPALLVEVPRDAFTEAMEKAIEKYVEEFKSTFKSITGNEWR